ncbi:hypothetical protein ACFC0M_19695 [Streptomyces sp. NPDC056149]|uniref:hypothetical protein n=1 Tax=unclassified Streptomyces TaxID=2593676 RepID=UPI0023813A1E|nr:hypothetical protein [Streptomyces sp. WZ-12]
MGDAENGPGAGRSGGKGRWRDDEKLVDGVKSALIDFVRPSGNRPLVLGVGFTIAGIVGCLRAIATGAGTVVVVGALAASVIGACVAVLSVRKYLKK